MTHVSDDSPPLISFSWHNLRCRDCGATLVHHHEDDDNHYLNCPNDPTGEPWPFPKDVKAQPNLSSLGR